MSVFRFIMLEAVPTLLCGFLLGPPGTTAPTRDSLPPTNSSQTEMYNPGMVGLCLHQCEVLTYKESIECRILSCINRETLDVLAVSTVCSV